MPRIWQCNTGLEVGSYEGSSLPRSTYNATTSPMDGVVTDNRSVYILGGWTCTVTSSADCILHTGIVSADKYSRAFEKARRPEENYQDEAERQRQEAEARKSAFQKAMDWGRENRYPIVGGSWVASMVIALGLVGRSPHLSTQQKIVQARVYAQGLTLAVLVATAAFEIGDKGKGEGRWETVKIVDPNDPTHKHLIDKKIHHERYAGEDQWRGGLFLQPWECFCKDVYTDSGGV